MLRRYSLELNTDKTKFIASNEGQITYQGREIERVLEYKYLGKVIQQNLTHESHLAKQLTKAEKTNA